MPRPALWILLVLALPLLVIGVTSPIEWSRETRGNWFLGVAAACFVLGLVIVSIFALRNPRRRGLIDERARERENQLSAVWMSSVIAELALICAGSVTQLGLIITGVAIAWTLAWIPRWMRHIGVQTTAVIGRDQSTVFSFVADQRNSPRYMPELESVEKVTEGPIGSGTQFRSSVRLGDGETLGGVDEIVDYEPPNRVSSRTVTTLRPNGDLLTLESVPEGTRLKHRFDSEISYSNAVMHQGLMKPLMVLDLRQRRNAVWERLKQLLESEAGA
jgi:Polyketide cyclase / dehydrase and lipid transport